VSGNNYDSSFGTASDRLRELVRETREDFIRRVTRIESQLGTANEALDDMEIRVTKLEQNQSSATHAASTQSKVAVFLWDFTKSVLIPLLTVWMTLRLVT
jgi:hypothetical protein